MVEYFSSPIFRHNYRFSCLEFNEVVSGLAAATRSIKKERERRKLSDNRCSSRGNVFRASRACEPPKNESLTRNTISRDEFMKICFSHRQPQRQDKTELKRSGGKVFPSSVLYFLGVHILCHIIRVAKSFSLFFRKINSFYLVA